MDLTHDIAASAVPAADTRRRSATVLACALALGVTTQALFWRTGVGLNFFLWDLLAVGINVAVFRRGRIGPTAWGAIACCVLTSFEVTRFASDWTLAIAVPANLAMLASLPILLRDGLTLDELAGLPLSLLCSLTHVPMAARRTVRLPGEALGGDGQATLRAVGKGLLIGVPTAGLFTLLLSSDPGFSHALVRIADRLGEGVLFAGCSLATAVGYVMTHGLHATAARPRVPGAAVYPYRVAGDAAAAGAPVSGCARVGVVTWAMVIGQVALIFGLFVAANLRHLFGGDALVRSPGALTYAGYLHAGFAQLLVATVLSVCLVLTGHALLRPRGTERGSGVPGGLLLTSLEAALIALTGITVVSCWQRLGIYVEAYGASRLRLGVAMIELGVLAVLVLTLVKVVRRRWTGHAGALLALFAGLAVVATGINADAYVAGANLDRAMRGKALDVEYLASLSIDARGVLGHPFVQANPEVQARLEASFAEGCGRGSDLRARRGLGRCAP